MDAGSEFNAKGGQVREGAGSELAGKGGRRYGCGE